MSGSGSLFQVTEVAGYAGKSQNAGFLIEHVHNACNIQVLFLCDVFHDSRIHIAGTGTHDQALKGSQTHAGINGFTVLYSRKACAVAQVANDDLKVLIGLSSYLGSLFGYEAVGGSVETVSSYLVILIVLVGKAVKISLLRHCLMESCIEYCYHGNARH